MWGKHMAVYRKEMAHARTKEIVIFYRKGALVSCTTCLIRKLKAP